MGMLAHHLRFRRGREGAATLTLLALLCVCPASSPAQERPFPYEFNSRDAVLAGISAGAGVVGLYLASRTEPLTLAELASLDRRSVNGFDRGATHNWSPTWQDRSDHPRNLLVVSSALLSGGPLLLQDKRKELVTVAAIFLEAAALTTAVTYTAKGLGKRLRPYAYNTALTPEERLAVPGSQNGAVRQSFISGHTSSAFAAAALLSTVYQDVHGSTTTSKIIWASSLSLASLTAYGRVKGGVHFPTDVLAGALVGVGIGYLVPALHRVEGSRRLRVAVSPAGVGLRLALGNR
jgi:membrane-associated phospholipid phosphatase